MQTGLSLRLGGICAIAGATGIFFSNFLHPFPPADRAAMLALVAAEPAWSAIHFPTMFFAVALLVALVALADSITVGRPAVLAHAGRVVAQVGVPVMLVGVAIDGFGFKTVADAWARAADPGRAMLLHAADAVVLAETGIVHTWVTFFLGLAFLLYGLAVATGRDYPRWIGWAGVAGGLGCLGSGAAGFLQLPLTMPFPVFATADLLFMFAMGIAMYRRSSASAASALERTAAPPRGAGGGAELTADSR